MIRPPPSSPLFPSPPLFRSSLVFRQFEAGLYDKRRVCVVHQVVVRQPVIFNRVTDHAAQKRDVRSRANLAEKIGNRRGAREDRKSTRLNSSHLVISYAVFCL